VDVNKGEARPAHRKCPCRMTEEELFAAHGVPYGSPYNGFHLPRVGDADELRLQIVETLADEPSEPERVGEIIERVTVTAPLATLRRVG
jgi:hypothetical protein